MSLPSVDPSTTHHKTAGPEDDRRGPRSYHLQDPGRSQTEKGTYGSTTRWTLPDCRGTRRSPEQNQDPNPLS